MLDKLPGEGPNGQTQEENKNLAASQQTDERKGAATLKKVLTSTSQEVEMYLMQSEATESKKVK